MPVSRGAGRRRAATGDPVVVVLPPRDDATRATGAARRRGGVASVERRRLLARLTASTAQLVVLSAPAGAGKSTLLAQWDAVDSRTHLHVRSAPALDDPAALAWHLIERLEPVGDPTPTARTAVTAAEPGFSAVLLPTLTWLAASRTTPFVLVVDDAHLLTDASCHRVLAAVCDGVPPGSAVLVSTRTSAPAWVSRARATGALLEIGPESFALDDEEAARLFAELGLEPSPDQVRAAVRATEGWAVGLYLAALAATSGPVLRTDITPSGEHRFVRDYLRAEVLDGLDADARAFLLRTSILDELGGAVCDAVAGTTGGGARLVDLHRRLQLVIALDREGHRFRYHHLLSEALLALLREDEPDLEPELHRRAAVWYADHDRLDTAIRHAKASGDLALTGRLIWSDIHSNVGGNRPDHLRYRLSGLSDTALAADRWLTLEACWMHLQAADMDQAMRWLLTAQRHAGVEWRDRARTDEYAAQLAMPTALIGAVGLAGTIALCEDALVPLAPDDPFRAALMFMCGVSLTLLRDLPGGLQALLEAERLARALGVPIIVADSLSVQGLVAILAGDVERAATLIAGGADAIRDNDLERLASSAHCITAHALLLAMRRDPAAPETLATARRMTVAVGAMTVWFQSVGRLMQARTAILLGDGATARILLAEARQHMTPELAESLVQDLLVDTEAALRTLTADGVTANSLTSAELRVLQFLPSHLSFPQIGEHLFLSQNTVKTHALSIYRKFGVSSRADAVDRARALGLVDAATPA